MSSKGGWIEELEVSTEAPVYKVPVGLGRTPAREKEKLHMMPKVLGMEM